jgi:hypothetical protein
VKQEAISKRRFLLLLLRPRQWIPVEEKVFRRLPKLYPDQAYCWLIFSEPSDLSLVCTPIPFKVFYVCWDQIEAHTSIVFSLSGVRETFIVDVVRIRLSKSCTVAVS